MSEENGLDPDELSRLFLDAEEVGRRPEPSRLPIILCGLYLLAMPIALTILLTSALQAPDRGPGEKFARWLYFPFGDLVLVASGIVRAFSGYFVNDELAVFFSAGPLFLGTLIPVALQSALLLFAWWGLSRLVHLARQRQR